MRTTKNRIAIYARVSTDDQSADAQLLAVKSTIDTTDGGVLLRKRTRAPLLTAGLF